MRVLDQLTADSNHEREAEPVKHALRRLTQLLSSEAEVLPAAPRRASDAASEQHLLELLHRETVQGWLSSFPPPPAAEMLAFLRGYERLRAEVAGSPAGATPPWAHPQASDLVVELAHDLRSPLTSIIFLAETLRGGQAGAISDLQRRQLGIIYSAALSLVSMATDVIELARGGGHLMERRPSPLSIAELLESTKDVLRPIIEEKGLAVHIRAPEADQRFGHPVALSRVLLNLASNAIKFTDQGYVEIAARAAGGSRVEFSVRDTGPGIEAERQRDLFEPLRRHAGSKRFGFSGSGLGLAICRRLVHAMGGELRFETAPGWGTRFHFELDLPPFRIE